MKKKFFEAIRAGRKTTTLRYWRNRRLSPGQIHRVPGLGKVRILDVRQVELSELTDRDAQADGFASRADLLSELRQIYPEMKVPPPKKPGRRDRAPAKTVNRATPPARRLYLVRFCLEQ
jgi:hypothetical protein